MKAILYGILIKLYDEVIDMKLDFFNKEWMKRSVEYIIVVLQYLLMVDDFNFSIVFYLANVIQAFIFPQNWEGPYETSLLILTIIPLLLSIPTYIPFTLFSLAFGTAVLLLFCIEPYYFPEEVSLNKLVFRFILGMLQIVLLLTNITESVPWITKLLMIGAGYIFISVIFQLLKLHEALPVSSSSSIGTVSSFPLEGHIGKVLGDNSLKNPERNDKSENV